VGSGDEVNTGAFEVQLAMLRMKNIQNSWRGWDGRIVLLLGRIVQQYSIIALHAVDQTDLEVVKMRCRLTGVEFTDL